MAVAFSSSSESHTGTTGSTNQAAFSWTHTQTGTPQGVLVFVHVVNTATDTVTSVKYGSLTLTRVSGGAAVDTAGEPGRTDTFYLGAGLPSGSQTITVDRTNNANVLYAVAATVTGATNETQTTGIVLLEGDGTLAEQSVTDGSPGSNSLRFAAIASGLAAPPAAGASSTLLQSIDFGQNVCAFVRETTAGQGARNVGFSSGTSDDRAAVHLAVREKFALAFTADSAAFGDTLNDANLKRSLKLVADSASFNDTFADAIVAKSFRLTADRAQFSLAGNAAALKQSLRFIADRAPFNDTLNNANFARGLRFTADRAAFSLSGSAAALNKRFYLAADRAQFTGIYRTAAFVRSLRFTADRGPFTLTGGAAALAKTFLFTADKGTFSLAGGGTAYRRQLQLVANRAQFSTTGSAANFKRGLRFIADRAAFALSGNTGIRLSFKVALTRGDYALTGQAAALYLAASQLPLGAGVFAFTGNAAFIGRLLDAKRARYEIAASGARLIRTYRVPVLTVGFATAGQSVLFIKSFQVGVTSAAFGLVGTDAIVAARWLVRFSQASFALTAGSVDLFKVYRLATSTCSYALSGSNAGVRRSAYLSVARSEYFSGIPDAGLQRSLRFIASSVGFILQFFDLGFRNNTAQPASGQPRPIVKQPYGGSTGSDPSFLHPQFTRYNSVTKARDLGTVDNLLALVQGQVGAQSGASTIYLKVETTGPAQLQLTIEPLNPYTNRYLSVGLLDGDRRPIPLDAAGNAQPSQVALATPYSATSQLPAGIYYFTISGSQWQAIDYKVLIKVARYVAMSGVLLGTAPLQARLAMVRLNGVATMTAPMAATAPGMSSIKALSGAIGVQAQPRLALSIMRGAVLLQMSAYGRLKQTHRMSGAAPMSGISSGTLTSTAPYGGGYGY